MLGTGEQGRNVVFPYGIQNLVGDKDKQLAIFRTITMIRLDPLTHSSPLYSQSQNPF